MNGKSTKSLARHDKRPGPVLVRRPFWLPASSYYVMTMAVVIAFFFVTWGVLYDSGEVTPWVTAGVGSSVILFGAVILREIILRRARNRYLVLKRSFDRQLSDAYSRIANERHSEKLTIEQNAAILRDIEQKSNAAKTLGKFAAVHREVFELCGEYLDRNERELSLIGVGSPRLGPLRKSKEKVSRYHRFHMLHWAEIEARDLTLEAKNRSNMTGKVDAAQSAISVIEKALEFYPEERALIESRDVVIEMLASIKVSHWIEKAERAAFRGDHKAARNHYRDALFYLGRDNVYNENRELASSRINAEIEKLERFIDNE